MYKIVLTPCVFEPLPLLPALQTRLEELLQIPVEINKKMLDLEVFFDVQRGQYNALQIIQSLPKKQTEKTILCTTVDLFIPIFTFVFGLARLSGCCGIISTHRLVNRYYGLPDDPELLSQRMVKEAVHELGHLAGLKHCQQYDCVMASSATADDIDIKSEVFCPNCFNQFKQHFASKPIF